MLFDEDLALEIHAIAQLHEFVGVAGITVFAAELAAAIRIDHPCEWHTPGDATRKHAAVFDGQVLNVVAVREGLPFGGKSGDTNQRLIRFDLGEKRCHRRDFVFYSLR
jgi:hypothetical protein